MSARLLLIHCLSPLHAGTGQGVDVVDLSIARERATGYPYLPGSSLKGSLRSLSTQNGDDSATRYTFGPPTRDASDHAGALAFGDGNLLCLPVRSLRGTFSYVTSPYLLQRFARDLPQTSLKALPKIPSIDRTSDARTSKHTMLRYEEKVIFEDFDFDARDGAEDIAAALAPLIFEDKELQKIFQQRFCIVHDDVMSFLSRNATDVVTRIGMDSETKTVKKGQLWTEENLPAETILSALVTHIPTRAQNGGSPFKHLSTLTRGEVQLGGKATVGRGRCLTRVLGGKE